MFDEIEVEEVKARIEAGDLGYERAKNWSQQYHTL